MKEKEKVLLNSLYNFYAEEKSSSDVEDGDEITYNKPDSMHSGKSEIYKGTREDGKYKMKIDNIIFHASPKYIKKIDKPRDMSRLMKILNQMVIDGDLSKDAVSQFMKEVIDKDRRKSIDPYGEENWEEDAAPNRILPRRRIEPVRNVENDGCGSGARSNNGRC